MILIRYATSPPDPSSASERRKIFLGVRFTQKRAHNVMYITDKENGMCYYVDIFLKKARPPETNAGRAKPRVSQKTAGLPGKTKRAW